MIEQASRTLGASVIHRALLGQGGATAMGENKPSENKPRRTSSLLVTRKEKGPANDSAALGFPPFAQNDRC